MGRDDRSQPAKPTATGREEIMRKMENSLVSLGQHSMGKFNENSQTSQSFLSTRCRETSKNHLSLSSANQLMRIVTHCHITGDDRCVSLLFCVLRAALQFPQERASERVENLVNSTENSMSYVSRQSNVSDVGTFNIACTLVTAEHVCGRHFGILNCRRRERSAGWEEEP